MKDFKKAWQRLKETLFYRQRAYQEVFNPKSVNAKHVLKDLAQFCRAHESTFSIDERAQSLLEGRREVWLRIQNHLELDSHTLWELYGRKES